VPVKKVYALYMSLTKGDYIKILKYYDLNVPKSTKGIKESAERVMANKLCRCIKKVDPANEKRGIGICTRTIFNKKGITRGTFKCKKTRKHVTMKKRTKKNRTKKARSVSRTP